MKLIQNFHELDPPSLLHVYLYTFYFLSLKDSLKNLLSPQAYYIRLLGTIHLAKMMSLIELRILKSSNS